MRRHVSFLKYLIFKKTRFSDHTVKYEYFCKFIMLGREHPFALKLLEYSKNHKIYLWKKKLAGNSIIHDLDSWIWNPKKSKKIRKNTKIRFFPLGWCMLYRFPWHPHPQGRMSMYLYIYAKSRKIRVQYINSNDFFSSQRFFSRSWNNSSEHAVLWLLIEHASVAIWQKTKCWFWIVL